MAGIYNKLIGEFWLELEDELGSITTFLQTFNNKYYE